MSYDACTRAGKWGPMVLSRAGDVLMCPHMVPVPLSYWFSLAKEFSGCSPGHKGTHTRLPRTLASALVSSRWDSHSLSGRTAFLIPCVRDMRGAERPAYRRADTPTGHTRTMDQTGSRGGRGQGRTVLLVLVPLEFSRCCSAAPRLPGSRGLAHRVSPFPGPKRHEICVYPVHLYRGLPRGRGPA